MSSGKQLTETMLNRRKMSNRMAVRYNPYYQHLTSWFLLPRACDLRTLFRILIQALKSYENLTLMEEAIWSLRRIQRLVTDEFLTLKILFWLAVAVLHLNEESLFAAGLVLLQDNLSLMDDHKLFKNEIGLNHGVFGCASHKVRHLSMLDHLRFSKERFSKYPQKLDCQLILSNLLMKAREPIEEEMKQLEHHCGLCFHTDFDVALAATLLKGYHHSSPVTRDRTSVVLRRVLDMTAGVLGCDTHKVNDYTGPYLAALALQSEEVLLKCPFLPRTPSQCETTETATIPQPTRDEPTGGSSSAATKSNALMNPNNLISINVRILVVAMLAKMWRTTKDEVTRGNLLNYLIDAETAFPDLTPLVVILRDKKFVDEMSQLDTQDRTTRLKSIIQGGQKPEEKSTLRVCSILPELFSSLWTNAEAFTENSETRTIAGIIASIIDKSAEEVLEKDLRLLK